VVLGNFNFSEILLLPSPRIALLVGLLLGQQPVALGDTCSFFSRSFTVEVLTWLSGPIMSGRRFACVAALNR
jgi:hypothetical protein